jgi:hypothetical protein
MNRFFKIVQFIGSAFEYWCQFGVMLFALAILGPFLLLITIYVACLPILYIQMMLNSSSFSELAYYSIVLLVVVGISGFGVLKYFYSNRPTREPPYFSNAKAEAISKQNLRSNSSGIQKGASRRSLLRRD